MSETPTTATPENQTPTAPDFSAIQSVAEFRAVRDQAAAPDPSAAPVAVDPPVESPEQEADSAKPDPDVSEAARQLRKNRADERKKQIQAEIADLIRQRNELRSDLTRSQPRPTDPTPAPPVALTPAPGAFQSFEQWSQTYPEAPYEAYVQAAIRHEVDARLAAERAAVQRQHVDQTYLQRVEAYAAEHPDFREALASAADVEMPVDALEAIKRHPLGPAVAHHLATHRDVAAQLAHLPPADLFLALGELVATVGRPAASPPAPKALTKAPAPITPIGGSANGPVTRDPKDINSLSEWRQRRAEFAGTR